MENEVLYVDIGATVTTARAVTVSGDAFATRNFAVCPTPPATSHDLAGAVPLVLQSMRGEAPEAEDILVTINAGGEPRVVCAGVVQGISGESAKRAALAAGATVADLIAVDDGRRDHERISDLSRHDVTMVVLAGGVDEGILDGGKHQLINIAKVIAEGLPNERGKASKVSVVYAASLEGREEVSRILGDSARIIWADNVRSTLEEEHLDSARNAVLGVFEESVRVDPRFSYLGRFGAPAVSPTGHVQGLAVEDYSQRTGENLLVVSLDDGVQVLSAINGVFTRTVTPVDRVEEDKVLRLLPSARLGDRCGDTLGNWKLRPHLLPCTWDEMAIFLALWKEALREAMRDHRRSSIELRGVHRQRLISETFEVESAGGDTLVRMERIDKVIFTGHLARHIPPAALASIALDGLDPIGLTGVFLDPGDVLSLTGLLLRSGRSPKIEDDIRPIGLLVNPYSKQGRALGKQAFLEQGGVPDPLMVERGKISAVALDGPFTDLAVAMEPVNGTADLGDGDGRRVTVKVLPGTPSVYLDGRDRRASQSGRSAAQVLEAYKGLKVFPDDTISRWSGGMK